MSAALMRLGSGRRLALAACCAARAFAARQARAKPGEHGGAWNPLWLRWARAGAGGRNVPRFGARRYPTVSAMSFLHLNMHFGIAGREGGIRGRVKPEVRHAAGRFAVLQRDGSSKATPSVGKAPTLAMAAQRSWRSTAAFLPSTFVWMRGEKRIDSRVARAPVDSMRVTPSAPESPKAIVPGIQSQHILGRASLEPHGVPGGYPGILSALKLARRRRLRERPAANPAREAERASSSAPSSQYSAYMRSPTLVWRAKTTQDDSSANRRAIAQRTFSSLESPTQQTSSPVAPAHTAQAPEAKPAARLSSVDPALADRLADDVIRRVERRIRIERERRGI